MQVQPDPQARWTEKTIVMDCLDTSKTFALNDSFNELESQTITVRNAFARMRDQHAQLAYEAFDLARKRGWYPAPAAASAQKQQQLLQSFQPVPAGVAAPAPGNQPANQGAPDRWQYAGRQD